MPRLSSSVPSFSKFPCCSLLVAVDHDPGRHGQIVVVAVGRRVVQLIVVLYEHATISSFGFGVVVWLVIHWVSPPYRLEVEVAKRCANDVVPSNAVQFLVVEPREFDVA